MDFECPNCSNILSFCDGEHELNCSGCRDTFTLVWALDDDGVWEPILRMVDEDQ